MGNMYEDSAGSLNFHVGCRFGCTYCVPSFQRQMKRQKNRCMDCWRYIPHTHLDRLERTPPKTKEGQFIFFPSSSDWAWITIPVGYRAIRFMEEYPDRDFLLQSKDPATFRRWSKFPENAILGTTMETNRDNTVHFSTAPRTCERYQAMLEICDNRRTVTVEPVMDFDTHIFYEWIREIDPWRVWVGYNSRPKEIQLPEPSLEKTSLLITLLKDAGVDVREKIIRDPWVSGR